MSNKLETFFRFKEESKKATQQKINTLGNKNYRETRIGENESVWGKFQNEFDKKRTFHPWRKFSVFQAKNRLSCRL